MGAELNERAERPAYVRFKRVAVEDKQASLAARQYIAKDVDFALITPPYSRDVIEVKVAQWLINMEADVRNGRMSKDWQDQYLKAHRAWVNGQEIPLNGAPIRGWGVISPAQQETLIRLNILTVEDLAAANDEGLRRIGMGALDLKNKARAWLAQLGDKGPLTVEMAALQQRNSSLESEVATLRAQVTELMKSQGIQMPAMDSGDEIMPEIPEVRRGRPRKNAEAA